MKGFDSTCGAKSRLYKPSEKDAVLVSYNDLRRLRPPSGKVCDYESLLLNDVYAAARCSHTRPCTRLARALLRPPAPRAC